MMVVLLRGLRRKGHRRGGRWGGRRKGVLHEEAAKLVKVWVLSEERRVVDLTVGR